MLLWFRKNIEIFWKILATLILGFYVWFFFKEISQGYTAFMTSPGWQKVTINFLTELSAIVFTSLFYLWPLSLIIIFYKSDSTRAMRLLKFMCVLTLILWILFIFYGYINNKELNQFIDKNIRQMFPKAK